jgi:hypothetical protein
MLVIVGFGIEAGDFGCIPLIDMFFSFFFLGGGGGGGGGWLGFNLMQPHCASGWFFIV